MIVCTAMDHDPKACWYAVYGAFVALQIQQQMKEGRGFPTEESDWETIRSEAATVANCDAESNVGRDIEFNI